MHTRNEVTPAIAKVHTSETSPVVYFYIRSTCTTKLHVKYLFVTCIENCTCDVINYVI